uniref:Potassium channel domain-containing protein n=1 Tax=Ditylenchus dipsaci TaxID=166011 RepID=A0A915E3E9_9BILA
MCSKHIRTCKKLFKMMTSKEEGEQQAKSTNKSLSCLNFDVWRARRSRIKPSSKMKERRLLPILACSTHPSNHVSSSSTTTQNWLQQDQQLISNKSLVLKAAEMTTTNNNINKADNNGDENCFIMNVLAFYSSLKFNKEFENVLHSLTSSSKPNLVRRPTIAGPSQIQVGQLDQRLTAQLAEVLQRSGAATGDTATIRRSTGTGGGGTVAVELPIPIVATTSSERRRRSRQISVVASAEVEDLLFGDVAPLQRSSVDLSQLQANNNAAFHPDLSQSSPVDSLFSIRGAGRTHTVILRRPTITIHEDGRIQIDHVTARWDGTVPISGQAAGLLDIDDGATIITDTLKEDLTDGADTKSCPQQVVKYLKILTPHIILVSVLVGYLCLGAWILMMLETRTELMARSRKLVRLANLMTNFTADSWRLVNDAQTGVSNIHHNEWEQAFREYMTLVAENVDDRRPIRRELKNPDNLDNMHNKWTFPTSLLYVLTVLTTCGYGEVSVDTDTGKVFSVVFALNWNLMTKRVKEFCTKMFCKKKYDWRSGWHRGKLWFPIGAYVGCICLYCSMGSVMFINWEHKWSFIHAFHFGFNLIVTVGLGDIVVTDYLFLSLIVAFVIVGLSVVTMCVDLASTHLKAYFTRIHYFGRAKRFLGMSEELKE